MEALHWKGIVGYGMTWTYPTAWDRVWEGWERTEPELYTTDWDSCIWGEGVGGGGEWRRWRWRGVEDGGGGKWRIEVEGSGGWRWREVEDGGGGEWGGVEEEEGPVGRVAPACRAGAPPSPAPAGPSRASRVEKQLLFIINPPAL